jgi:NADH:ubiquinone oxidoreductase subunit F (NADH-binding)
MTAINVLATPAKWPRVLIPATPPAKPGNLEAAVKAGAFAALRRAVTELGPTATIAEVTKSELRGRAGAGFPAGEKWRLCALTGADKRYVVVNACQSDPAVLTDRLLLEMNPYAVLEGAAIGAFAVNAQEVIVAVRAEATDTIRVLEEAIDAAEKAGYIGDSVMGTAHEIHISVKGLQGAYMLGEETVLLKGIEGKRGQPEQQPPFPTTSGLFGRPTLVHSPQTFAEIPAVVRGVDLSAGTAGSARSGASGVRGAGTTRAAAAGARPATTAKGASAAGTATGPGPGTILVQVSGAVVNPGVAEVPLGTTLAAILDLAGGVTPGKQLKAFLVGGPSGGILPASARTTPFGYDTLEAAGAYVGSGSIVVIDASTCVVDLAAVLTRYCADEACGKTIPCRIGLRRMAEIGARITEGQPRGDELTRLADLSTDIVASSLCDHERRSTLSLLSIVRYFRDELDAHLLHSTCPAGTCQMMAVSRVRAGS